MADASTDGTKGQVSKAMKGLRKNEFCKTRKQSMVETPARSRSGRRDSVGSFQRVAPSLWLGYNYQFNPVSGQLAVTVRQTGVLPAHVQSRKSVNIHVRVQISTTDHNGKDQAEQKSDVCIVRKGQHQKGTTLTFPNVSLESCVGSHLTFNVYYKLGIVFKSKKHITTWTAEIDTAKILQGFCDWKNLRNL